MQHTAHVALPTRPLGPKQAPPSTSPLLLYDEECMLCRGFARIVAGADRSGRLRIAALQSTLGTAIRRSYPEVVGLESALWVDRANAPIAYGDTVIAALEHVGGAWGGVARALRLMPTSVRDGAYRALTRPRQWFLRLVRTATRRTA